MIITISDTQHGSDGTVQKLLKAFPDAVFINGATINPHVFGEFDRDKTVIIEEFDRAPACIVNAVLSLPLRAIPNNLRRDG